MAGDQPVAVIGAGIAGLSLALHLARAGRPVTMLERASQLAEVGAGIQLSPNASRILIGLGLGSALEAAAVRPDAVTIRDSATGETIVRMPLGAAAEARYGAPYWVMHRGDLQAALLAAVAAEPLISLHLGTSFEGVTDHGAGVLVDAFIGSDQRAIPAAALVGADGVWSSVRTKACAGGPAVYSGRTAWRATFPASLWTGAGDVLTGTGLWLGAAAHVVHYPIRGGRDINLIAAVDDDWIDERWDVVGDPSDLMRALRGWPEPVRRMLELPAAWRRWALCEAPAHTAWARGRTVLIGDAAHAMLPFMAQGGAMAIEDAAVLAASIQRGHGDMADRLTAYEMIRRSRVRAVVKMARRNATIYHLSGLPAKARNFAMRTMGPGALTRSVDWIYHWRMGV
jgi:salicylate hydroxylase